jgi:hypothetical protein
MSTNEDRLMDDMQAQLKVAKSLNHSLNSGKIDENEYDRLFSWLQAASAHRTQAGTAQRSGRGDGGVDGAAGGSAVVVDGDGRETKRAPNWWPSTGGGEVTHTALRQAVKERSGRQLPTLPDVSLLKQPGALKLWKQSFREYHAQLIRGLGHTPSHHSHDARGLKSAIECTVCVAKFRLVVEEAGSKYSFVKWESTLLDESDEKVKKPKPEKLGLKVACPEFPSDDSESDPGVLP